MAGRLSDDHMDQLESFIGSGPKTFRLLYSFTRDGCGLQPFHSKCDNQGPTLTVLYNPQGSVYGGYTSLAWQSLSPGQWKQDDLAFLFQLVFSNQKLCRKFPSNKTDKSVYQYSLNGPYFGSGPGLRSFYNLNNNLNSVNGVFSLSRAKGEMKPSIDYEYSGVKTADINNATMDVVEGEVYSVTDGQRPKRLITTTASPWKKYPTMDETFLGKLREEVGTLTPPSPETVADFRLLVTGPVGSGKSSFINTMCSVFAGRIKQPAMTGNSPTGITKQYTAYRYRTQSGKHLAVRLCDTPGHGVTPCDLHYLMDGHVPENYQFNPTCPFSLKSRGSLRSPTQMDEVHAIAVVIDAPSVTKMSEDTRKQIADVIGICVSRGIPQALYITKIDKLGLDLNNDYTNIFKDPTVKRLVETVSEMFGVPENNVMLVKNYAQEVDVETDVDILALLALHRLQHLALDRLELLVSPEVAADSAVDLSNMSDTA